VIAVMREAQRLAEPDEARVGTGDLLQALALHHSGVAGAALSRLGVTPAQVQQAVAEELFARRERRRAAGGSG
jgi:hypothetical protein